MYEPLDMSTLYRVSQEEFQANVDCMLEKVESGCSPILICRDGKPNLLVESGIFSGEGDRPSFMKLGANWNS